MAASAAGPLVLGPGAWATMINGRNDTIGLTISGTIVLNGCDSIVASLVSYIITLASGATVMESAPARYAGIRGVTPEGTVWASISEGQWTLSAVTSFSAWVNVTSNCGGPTGLVQLTWPLSQVSAQTWCQITGRLIV